MDDTEMIAIEVVYGLPELQVLLEVDVPWGTTLEEGIELSGIRERISGIQVAEGLVGIFGKKQPLDFVLRAGDRIEIYRPLIGDPKEIRRQRAKKEG